MQAQAQNVTVIPARRRVGSQRTAAQVQKTRVAAYCRVSTDSEEQETSYEAQVSHYTEYIQSKPEWQMVEVYADDGISGTNTAKRDEFNRMKSDFNTHLRRSFVDALPKDIKSEEASKPAEAVLRLNKLFDIESELEQLEPEDRKTQRILREKRLLEDFWSWSEKNAVNVLPKSKLSTAFHYALNNRREFFNYLEDGNCSISNSLAENCIRPFVIGRKNWLFSGSPNGATVSAGIYTLVETAKINGLDPMQYIKYILSDMPGTAFLEYPEYLDDYLPWNPYVKEICT